MKLNFVLPAVFAFASLATSHADNLSTYNISITGKIDQQSASVGKTTLKTMPVTIKNILKVLNITGFDPATLRYYYDVTIGGYVIAPKGIQSTDDVTPVTSVYSYDSAYETVQKSPDHYYYAGGLTAFGDNLTGSYTDSYHTGPYHETDKITGYGTIDGMDTIVSMKVMIK